MQLRYDEDFIEAAVFLCASGRRRGVPSLQIARFHRQREKLYGILDPDDRNTAFFNLHLEWFREWGVEQPLLDILSEYPLLRDRLAVLAVRKTTGRTDEGAELYVNDAGQRTGLLALRMERLLDVPALQVYLRHEFTHLHDMLSPDFGYAPELSLPGLNAAQKRLARERYRLLWDITIDGRLAAGGHQPSLPRERYQEAFDRGYPFWPDQRRADTFASLWQGTAPRHAHLVELISAPRGLGEAHLPAPGASCPLCDFPTFAWADSQALSPAMINRIVTEFPAWSPAQGLCARCREAYQSAVETALAASACT